MNSAQRDLAIKTELERFSTTFPEIKFIAVGDENERSVTQVVLF